MATDRDRQIQMRSINRNQEPGLQQVLEPSGLGRLPSGPDDNQAQLNVSQKTIYTRTELPSRGLSTTRNHSVQSTSPSDKALDKATATTKSLTQIRTEIDLEVAPGQIKKTPSVH